MVRYSGKWVHLKKCDLKTSVTFALEVPGGMVLMVERDNGASTVFVPGVPGIIKEFIKDAEGSSS